MKRIVTSITLLLLSSSIYAQISVVKNINPGAANSNPYPLGLGSNGNLLFLANDPSNGYELWTSDGTTAGTNILVDMNPGPTGSFSWSYNVPYNGKIYFTANDGTHGVEPWVTDGTAAGTMMLKDINPGAASSFVGANFAVYNSKVYFTADDGTNGTELWSTDGTTGGTNIVKNINPGAASSSPSGLQVALGKLFFTAITATNGREWWISDGSTSGTSMITDLNPGASDGASSSLAAIVVNGSNVYLAAKTAATGYELYSTDGTSLSLVKDINTGAPDANPAEFMIAGGKVYFVATDASNGRELWMTDGTGTGTALVKNIEPGAGNSDPILLGELNGKLFFSANTTTLGRELWTSDGNTIGTTNLMDINSGSSSGVSTNYNETYNKAGNNYSTSLSVVNGKYYFTGNDGTNGSELWVTDGTAAGTTMIPGQIGVNPTNTASSGLDWIFIVGNYAWLRANDGNTGIELFRYKVNNINVPVVKNDNGFAVYPNPSHGTFTIQLKDANFTNATVTVYDIMGRVVKSQNINQQTSVVNLDAPKGNYIVKLQLDGSVMTQRVVVE